MYHTYCLPIPKYKLHKTGINFYVFLPLTASTQKYVDKVVQPLCKTVWWSKNLKIELPHNPEIPLLGIYPKVLIAGTGTCIFTPVIAALFATVKK